MSEEIENPFDKEVDPTEPVVAGTEEVASVAESSTQTLGESKTETPASTDYSKYASMAETPDANEHRKFDYVAVSGGVETETITTEAGEVERRKPAKAFKLYLTKDRDVDDKYPSEELDLPLTVVPIKYRMVMEQRTGAKGEVLVRKSSEFNGKPTDLVTINRFSADGKVVSTEGPMTVLEARKKYQTEDGKNALRDKVHLYSLIGGELVRFVVKGTGLWEKEDDLSHGKTDASRAKYPFLTRYLSEFAINDPYFLYEMKVDAAYRDHGSIKYYRPTFVKGNRISPETEAVVLEHLEDLYKYFGERDEAIKNFVATANATVVEEPVADVPFGSDAGPDGQY